MDNQKNCDPSNEVKNATQMSISKERIKICDALYESAGKTIKLQNRYNGEKQVFGCKKRLFARTEGSYRRYRNLQMRVGTKILQTNESLKANIGLYNQSNKDLYGILKNIAKGIKDVKAKFADFKDMAGKLDSSKADSCNTAQWNAMIGKAGCSDTPLPGNCKEVSEKIFNELVHRPKGLAKDIDSIFKASFDVVGIQIFSNTESLDPLQKALTDKAKDFEKHLSETMKKREADLKKLQEELTKSVQDVAKALTDMDHERSNFEGYKDAAAFLCCPACGCIKDERDDCGSDPRKQAEHWSNASLHCCEKDICKICNDVKYAFCGCDAPPATDSDGC
jgi:flagellar motility protein MotE (MotC chaperone)